MTLHASSTHNDTAVAYRHIAIQLGKHDRRPLSFARLQQPDRCSPAALALLCFPRWDAGYQINVSDRSSVNAGG